jgi:hypothetical protein
MTRKKDFTFTWEVQDGYCGGSAPQYTSLDPDDLDREASKAEISEWIEDTIREDFEQIVSPGYKNEDLSSMVDKVHAYLQSKKED